MREDVFNNYAGTTGSSQDCPGQTGTCGYPTEKSPKSSSVVPTCDPLLLQVRAWCTRFGERNVGSRIFTPYHLTAFDRSRNSHTLHKTFLLESSIEVPRWEMRITPPTSGSIS